MLNSKNESHVETIIRKRKLSIIDRVMRGDRFQVAKDRFGFTYRFEREEGGDYTFYVNNMLAGVCGRGAFLPGGFVVTLSFLGTIRNHSVLCGDIRFIDNELLNPVVRKEVEHAR